MDMRVSTVSPVVRCIIIGENQSVLLFREDILLTDSKGVVRSSHWDLPRGKINQKETAGLAAQRIVYNKSGLFAGTVEELIVRPTKFQNVSFIDHHHYFVVRDPEGVFTRNEYAKGKEGVFQWVEYEHVSCYAVRKETMAMLQVVFDGHPT